MEDGRSGGSKPPSSGDGAAAGSEGVPEGSLAVDAVEGLLSKETSLAQLRNFLVKLEQGHFKRVAEARIAELKNLGIEANEQHMTPREKELAKKACGQLTPRTMLPQLGRQCMLSMLFQAFGSPATCAACRGPMR